jgi:rhamnosyl/mannosyltransferase
VKVLHLGKFDTLGGIERHVRALASGLVATGEVDVVNLVSSDAARTDRHDEYGYPTVRAGCWGTAFSVALSPTLPLLARQLHREHRFDLIHLHFPDPLGHLTTLMLPRSIKRVISWHSDIVRQQSALVLYGPFMRSFVRASDAIIGATPQHLSGSTQIPAGKPGQIRLVIPYGFDSAQMNWNPAAEARARQLRAVHNGRALLFAVGRHVYYKGFEVLLRSMRDIDATLLLGGTGPMTSELQREASGAGVQDRVHFTGYIPENELIAYYSACDVFVLPSTGRSEAFGLVQLEAMHCGKPVVGTRLGTGVEFVNQDGITGLLVVPNDAGALATAINRLLGDPRLRERMGQAGRARVAQAFSVRQMIDSTLDLYRRVLAVR